LMVGEEAVSKEMIHELVVDDFVIDLSDDG
jgi:hypothetical protein